MTVAIRVMFPVMLLLVLSAAASAAQVAQQSGSSTAERAASPPLEAVSRDPEGRLVVRAFRIAEPIRLDGRLDESTYRSLPAIGGFLQSVPKEGAPASERTEAWVLYDDDHVYVAARCWDSAPPERWVANELRRDTNQLRQNDTFGVLFDTFHDRRSGFAFYTNAIGAIADYAIVDEGIPNTDWNPVWSVRTGRFEGGWTVEMAIPFKSLRYRPDATQNWGIQFRRAIRRKNEWTYLTPVPAAMGGPQGLNRVSLGATLIGLEPPSASKNVEIKPYVISRLTTDRLRVPPLDNDPSGNAGVDAKFGLTANLTADLTYNTDFAQVEIDEQQVNLTRFSLFFPEKREFFLESRGLFDFGRGGAFGFGSGIPGIAAGGGGSGGFASLGGGIVPSLFYSRRIGLNRNRVIPIDLGARLTGKAGPFGIGLLNIQTDDEVTSATPATNFTVMRIKRDILRRSSIGAMFTNRSRSNLADGSNQAFGIDGVFSFRQDIALGGYYARTRTPGLDGKDTSYQARFEYGADRYGARLDHLYVGDHFNPEVGFVQRDNFRRSFASARFSPRPASIRRVRKFNWEGSLEYIRDGSGVLETRVQTARFGTEFESSDLFNVEVRRDYERLIRPFSIARDVSIPVGAYQFTDVQTSYTFGAQRRASGTITLQRGAFYDGTITGVSYTGGRISVTRHLSLEPSLSINDVDLPAGDFTTRLFRIRTDYAFSPRMFSSALLQYSSGDRTFSSNLRFRWEYRPGSELFVVYTDERDTRRRAPAYGLRNRAFVVKVNRLFRF